MRLFKFCSCSFCGCPFTLPGLQCWMNYSFQIYSKTYLNLTFQNNRNPIKVMNISMSIISMKMWTISLLLKSNHRSHGLHSFLSFFFQYFQKCITQQHNSINHKWQWQVAHTGIFSEICQIKRKEKRLRVLVNPFMCLRHWFSSRVYVMYVS